MNYDAVIVEMLSRIKALEERVKKLEAISDMDNLDEKIKTSTNDILNYIISLKKTASDNRKMFLILTARDIHGALNLKQRYPMVCNAMRQAMRQGDEIVFSPKSGYSSTLKIKYYL